MTDQTFTTDRRVLRPDPNGVEGPRKLDTAKVPTPEGDKRIPVDEGYMVCECGGWFKKPRTAESFVLATHNNMITVQYRCTHCDNRLRILMTPETGIVSDTRESDAEIPHPSEGKSTV